MQTTNKKNYSVTYVFAQKYKWNPFNFKANNVAYLEKVIG